MFKGLIISNFLLLSVMIVAQPNFVTVAGSFQSEAGCPGDWKPDCATTHLVYDAQDQAWQGTFNLPTGTYEYKVAIDNSWTENYGAGAIPNGAFISFTVPMVSNVKFYYDPQSHWVTNNVNNLIVTAAGSFQSELGCAGDWDPSCLASWLLDVDGDGIYTRTFTTIPAGSYEFKIAINESLIINYPALNVPFVVPPGNNISVVISFNSNNNEVSVDVQRGSAPIPVLETWGFMILLLSFSIIGIQMIRKSETIQYALLPTKK